MLKIEWEHLPVEGDMGLLLSRGCLVLELPYGRLWITTKRWRRKMGWEVDVKEVALASFHPGPPERFHFELDFMEDKGEPMQPGDTQTITLNMKLK